MNNDNYQKNFNPLLLWLVIFVIGMNAFPRVMKMIPSMTATIQTKISIILMYGAILLLAWIIKKTEMVYCVMGGPSFEQAKEAGEEARQLYAKKVFDMFFKSTVLAVLFLGISYVLKLSAFYDWAVAGFCLLVAALGIIKTKFDDCINKE